MDPYDARRRDLARSLGYVSFDDLNEHGVTGDLQSWAGHFTDDSEVWLAFYFRESEIYGFGCVEECQLFVGQKGFYLHWWPGFHFFERWSDIVTFFVDLSSEPTQTFSFYQSMPESREEDARLARKVELAEAHGFRTFDDLPADSDPTARHRNVERVARAVGEDEIHDFGAVSEGCPLYVGADGFYVRYRHFPSWSSVVAYFADRCDRTMPFP